MSSESSAAVENEAGSDGSLSQQILVFELEGAAIDGRAKLFDAAKSVFKSSGVKLNDAQFASVCTQGAVPAIIEKLIADAGDGKVDDGAADKIFQNYVAGVSKSVHVHPLFTDVIEEAGKRGIKAFAISSLPEEAARAALKSSGLNKHGVILHVFPSDERHFPRVDCWMKVGREVSRQPRSCIAVAGCRDSGKSALSAGMRSIVIPDQYTSYQDFGGTDAVLENAEDYDIKDLFESFA